MMKFLEHEIGDKNFLRYIKRFLKSGIMEEGKYIDTDSGVAQGGLCRARHNPPYVGLDDMPSSC
jgi:retron-type reverse transcriptase